MARARVAHPQPWHIDARDPLAGNLVSKCTLREAKVKGPVSGIACYANGMRPCVPHHVICEFDTNETNDGAVHNDDNTKNQDKILQVAVGDVLINAGTVARDGSKGGGRRMAAAWWVPGWSCPTPSLSLLALP